MHRQADHRYRGDEREESDMGWPVSPEGFHEVLTQLDEKHDQSIFVTEHGIADRDDTQRGDYIEESIDAMSAAADDGVDVMGYMHWSLLDNVEWDKGRWPRFGLIEVDYDDMTRTVRDSAERYADIVAEKS
ncbi:MAG: family 1 glycosylhydrolase [Candidatus Nanohaloarchaea archaeon]|nr:family 1 glycosylhydrolase [Candidatus Nanohaloarchaea archaeon]